MPDTQKLVKLLFRANKNRIRDRQTRDSMKVLTPSVDLEKCEIYNSLVFVKTSKILQALRNVYRHFQTLMMSGDNLKIGLVRLH